MAKISREFGNFGEETAVKFLKEKGYQILERNFRLRGGEVDLIAEDGDVLVFVEVKNYSQDSMVNPEEVINWKKKKKIISSARFYCAKNKIFSKNIRFDVVIVRHKLNGTITSCELFKNAF